MKSRYALLGTVALLAVSATGCGGEAGGPGEKATLEFQTGLSVDASQMPLLESITERFEEENPDVDVELVAASQNYEADMKVRLASGDVPDIFYTHGWSLMRYSEFLEPLQDRPWAEHFNPALDDAMKNENGEFFALPTDTDIAGLIYNGDVLDAAGVSPGGIATWDDFSAAATKVKANGATPITVSGKDSGPAGNIADWIAPGAHSEEDLEQLLGGEFVDESYADVLEVIDGWREKDFFNPDYASATSDDMARALAEGNTAFVFSQNRLLQNAHAYNPEANLGFIPVPNLSGDTPYLIGGEMNAYGVAKESENKDAALAYIDFLAQPENIAELSAGFGSAPGLTNAEADLGPLQESYEAYVEGGEYPLVPYFDRVYLPNGMWNTMVTTADAVITGQASVEQATGQMAKDFESLYGQGS